MSNNNRSRRRKKAGFRYPKLLYIFAMLLFVVVLTYVLTEHPANDAADPDAKSSRTETSSPENDKFVPVSLSLPTSIIDIYKQTSSATYYSPVPESEAVSDSYFDDAVFVGDSRTESFAMYSGLVGIHSLSNVGADVSNAFTTECVYVGQEKVTIMDALAQTSFNKIYINFGINELGWPDSTKWKEEYAKIIDKVREINPSAIIYIQSIFPVSAEKDRDSEIYTISNIDIFNERLRELADEKKVNLVNVAEALKDDYGYLPEDASFDGVHLTPDYCLVWLNYLKTHTVKT